MMNILLKGLGIVLLIGQLALAIELTRIALRNQATSLRWLAAAFYASGLLAAGLGLLLCGLIPALFPGSLVMVVMGNIVSGLCVLMFIQSAFYRRVLSPMLVISGLALVWALWAFFVSILWGVDASVGALVMAAPLATWAYRLIGLMAVLPWSWHLWAAWRGYVSVARDKDVPGWVKGRYQLIMAYAGVLAVGSGGLFLLSGGQAEVSALLWAGTASVALVLQALAWFMPEGYWRWLDRNRPLAAAGSPKK